MKTIQLPVLWGGEIRSEFELMWYTPSCRRCELDGRRCGFVNDDGQTGCIDSSHGRVSSSLEYDSLYTFLCIEYYRLGW